MKILKTIWQIQKWIRGLGYPESMKEFRDLESEATMPANFGQVGDKHIFRWHITNFK